MTARRHATGLLVVLVLLAAACAGDSPRPATEAASGAEGTWRVLAAAPLRPAYSRRAVWSGTEMIVWGGSRVTRDFEARPIRGGAAYDPASDSWRRIPRAPIRGGSGYSLTWAGDEMIVWGDPDTGRSTKGSRGAAFDPATNEWRRIPGGPLGGRHGHVAVWTGDELVVWGGSLTASRRERYDGAGAAYDPKTNEWRRLAESPLPAGYDAMGAWTGTEVLVLVSPMGFDPEDYPKFAEVAAYDPSTDGWRELESPPFVTSVSPPVPFLDGELFLLSLGDEVDGGETDPYDRSYETGGIFDATTEEWRTHSDPPVSPDQTWEQTATGDEIVIDGLAYDPATDSWRTLPELPLARREFPVTVWTGEELIVWGGAKRVAGDPPPPLADGAAYTPPR